MAEINPAITYGKKRGATPMHKHGGSKVPVMVPLEGLESAETDSEEAVPPVILCSILLHLLEFNSLNPY